MKIISKKNILITVVSIFIFYTVFIFYTGFNEISNIYDSLNWFNLIPIIGILILTLFLRSLIQKFLLNQIGITLNIKDSFFLYISGLSMIITPGGSGIVIKSYFLKNKFDYDIAKTLPLTAIERFYELVGVIILLFFSFIWFFSFSPFIITLILSLLASITFFFVKTNSYDFIFKISNRIKIIKPFTDSPDFMNSIQILTKTKVTIFMILTISVITFFESVMFYIGFNSFNFDFSYIDSIQIFYSSILFGALFLIPAGIGVTEGFFVSLLLQKGISLETAGSIIIFLRLTTIWLISLIGFITAYLIFFKSKKS